MDNSAGDAPASATLTRMTSSPLLSPPRLPARVHAVDDDRPRVGSGSPASLAAMARSQGGAWTHQQALATGATPARIRWLLRGPWASPYRGVCIDRAHYARLEPEGRHVLLAAARVLSTRLGAVASHRTAALVHGLAVLGKPPSVPMLTRPPSHPGDTSSSADTKVTTLQVFSCTVVGGVPVTSLARTACDVGRTTSLQHAVVTLDAAFREGLSPEELAVAVELCRRWPGGGGLVAATALTDPRADTPIESLTRLRYREFGLPAPQSQIEVYAPDGRFVALVDFLFAEQGVVGEADGMEKYSGREVLREEKRRQEALVECGFEVLRNDWAEALRANRVAVFQARAQRAFTRAASRTPVPGVSFRIPSLAELQRRRANRGTARRAA